MQRRALEPNLQWWDRLDDHDASNAGLIHAPVCVYLRNYGGRPARIERAEFFIESTEEAELRSAPVGNGRLELALPHI